MLRILVRCIAAAGVLLAAAPARTACTNSDFSGVYSATVIGSFTAPPPGVPGGPTARVAKVESDGNGNAFITATLSLAGLMFSESYPGTYTINPDCTALVILQVQFPGIGAVPFTFVGVLAKDGLAMEEILVNPEGNDIRISLRKQRKTQCANGDLLGDYAVQMSGTSIFQFAVPTGPFARVGKASFDGAGKFSGSVYTNYGGKIVPEDLSGTYDVKSDCTFTVTFHLLQAWTWTGMLADSTSGANLIQSAPQGSVVTGTLTSVR